MKLVKTIGKVKDSGKLVIDVELGGQTYRTKDDEYLSICGEEWYKNGRGISVGGQVIVHLTPNSFRELFITKEQVERLFEIWSEWHLKNINIVPQEIIEELKVIMN